MEMFPKNYVLKLRRKFTEELSLTGRFVLLGIALEGRGRAKGRKFEKCKILILFKEVLSSNLCSPKMELAFSSSLSIPAGLGGSLLGTGSRPSARVEMCWFALLLRRVKQDEMITLGRNMNTLGKEEAWSSNLRLYLSS